MLQCTANGLIESTFSAQVWATCPEAFSGILTQKLARGAVTKKGEEYNTVPFSGRTGERLHSQAYAVRTMRRAVGCAGLV